MSNYRNSRKRQIVYRVLPRTTIKSNSKKTSCSTTIFLSILCKTVFIFSALSFNSPLIWPRKFCICFCLGTVVSWGTCNSLLTCYNVSSSCYIYWWSISVLVFSEPLTSLVQYQFCSLTLPSVDLNIVPYGYPNPVSFAVLTVQNIVLITLHPTNIPQPFTSPDSLVPIGESVVHYCSLHETTFWNHNNNILCSIKLHL